MAVQTNSYLQNLATVSVLGLAIWLDVDGLCGCARYSSGKNNLPRSYKCFLSINR